MIDISREEDRKAMVGTVTIIALLLVFLIMLGLTGCPAQAEEELDAGGVAVSIGMPDDGGPDNSAAEQQQEEEYTPPVVEEYTPENQHTSDVAEAPEVKKTKPTKKNPTKTPTKETIKETKKKPEKPVRKVDQKSLFPGSKKGSDDSGKGKGGENGKGGYKGRPDGTSDGSPNGNGGQGTQGDGPSIGTGISGGIGGFKVIKLAQPQGGIQEKGVIRLKVCVDLKGNVIPTSIKWVPDRNPSTSTNLQLRNRAIAALKKFQFANVSGSSGGCGFINFTFKLQ